MGKRTGNGAKIGIGLGLIMIGTGHRTELVAGVEIGTGIGTGVGTGTESGSGVKIDLAAHPAEVGSSRVRVPNPFPSFVELLRLHRARNGSGIVTERVRRRRGTGRGRGWGGEGGQRVSLGQGEGVDVEASGDDAQPD